MLSPDQMAILTARLTRTEGRRSRPYIDSVGKITIGVGHNLTDKGLPDAVIQSLLEGDINDALAGAVTLPVYDKLDPARQTVIVDMVFNMGIEKVREFVNTLGLLSRGDYAGAAENMLNSLWARQVGTRAEELARIIRDGHS